MQNRVILITGAASGIGLATARLLASKGARLSLSDTNSEGLEAIGKEIEAQWKGDDEGVMTRRVDVRLEEEVSWLSFIAWCELLLIMARPGGIRSTDRYCV